jgi:hypothetical protein
MIDNIYIGKGRASVPGAITFPKGNTARKRLARKSPRGLRKASPIKKMTARRFIRWFIPQPPRWIVERLIW